MRNIKAIYLSGVTFGLIGLAYACSEAELAGTGGSDFASGASGSGGETGSSSSASSSTGNTMVDITTSSSSGNPGSGGGSGGETGAGGALDPGKIDYPDDVDFEYEPRTGEGGGCGAVVGEAGTVSRPIDIIVSIDNSASMAGEIVAVQQRINEDFAAIIEDSDIDYRVIIVSRFGNVFDENYDGGGPFDSAFSICVGAPLSTLTCPASSGDATPAVANNPPRFFHHSTDIGSRNMWCRLTESFNESDPYPTARAGWSAVAPNGWGEFLREGAFKIFVGISDDAPNASGDGSNSNCPGSTNFDSDLAGAQAFDQAIRTLSPEQFGAYDAGDPDQNRNYAWYSIVGMAPNATPTPTPLEPDEPVETRCCAGTTAGQDCPNSNNTADDNGVRNGAGYQELSRMTGGLRYPSCFNDNFNDVFRAIAQGVIDRSIVPCQYDIPDVNGIINVRNIQAVYQPGGGGTPQTFPRAQGVDDCDGEEFYLDSNTDPTQLLLCPDACNLVQADVDARIDIDFGCLGS